MGNFEIYLWLLGIIACVGGISGKISVPTPLLLVIAGMLLSFIPSLPDTSLNPKLVLNIFLPILVYAGSVSTSWPEVKLNKRPIAMLSIGHVIFITVLVALVAHALIPKLPWALAFVLGAIVSPPDDVAIFAIAEKIRIPQQLLTVLMGESLLNDATALTIFRFALIAAVTHEFSAADAFVNFFAIIIGETLYGIVVGHVMGRIRLRIQDPMLQIVVSVITPFVAYIPAVRLGGSGVLATVVAGLILSHSYLERFSPDVRLLSQAVWDTIAFIMQSILFLLVGLNFEKTLTGIELIPLSKLTLLGGGITLTVIIGRFLWVYPTFYLPRHLFPFIRKNEPHLPWQFPFIISWAGMRGGVSLAAAMAIPPLALQLDGVDLRELIIFITFCVITATLLLQGITLGWVVKKIGLTSVGQQESVLERMDQLTAKLEMIKAVLSWLAETKKTTNDNIMLEEIHIQKLTYQAYQIRLEEAHRNQLDHQHIERTLRQESAIQIGANIICIEREVLLKLWQEGKINSRVRKKLLQQLDLLARRMSV